MGVEFLPWTREMSPASPFSDDVCRNRYDRIVFGAGVPGDSSRAAGAVAARGENAASRERRWLLELGAMTVLEAELETLSLGGSLSSAAAKLHGNDAICSGTQQAREREWYKSCLEAMLDGHYEALGEKCAWLQSRGYLPYYQPQPSGFGSGINESGVNMPCSEDSSVTPHFNTIT